MPIGQAPTNAEVLREAISQNYEGVPEKGTATKPAKTLLERWLEMFSAMKNLSIPLHCMSLDWKGDQPRGTPGTI
jgi:hypothetical protein